MQNSLEKLTIEDYAPIILSRNQYREIKKLIKVHELIVEQVSNR